MDIVLVFVFIFFQVLKLQVRSKNMPKKFAEWKLSYIFAAEKIQQSNYVATSRVALRGIVVSFFLYTPNELNQFFNLLNSR